MENLLISGVPILNLRIIFSYRMLTAVKFKGGHSHSILCVEARTDGSLFVSGGETGEICLWDRLVLRTCLACRHGSRL